MHGCRQLVSWDVGLSPATSATPVFSCQQVKLGTLKRLPVINRRKVGTTSNHHALYVLGYTRTTMAITKRSETAKWSETQKSSLSSDWRLKFAFMKPELLVMAGQHTAVNTFPGLVHTARHTMRVGGRCGWITSFLRRNSLRVYYLFFNVLLQYIKNRVKLITEDNNWLRL